jgi:hypothetical protein
MSDRRFLRRLVRVALIAAVRGAAAAAGSSLIALIAWYVTHR